MTEDDITFVRAYETAQEFRKRQGGKAPFGDIAIDAEDNLRLLTLLVEAEARGDKTEWQWRHNDCYKSDAGTWFCRGPLVDALHDLTDSDWQRSVRERWGLE